MLVNRSHIYCVPPGPCGTSQALTHWHYRHHHRPNLRGGYQLAKRRRQQTWSLHRRRLLPLLRLHHLLLLLRPHFVGLHVRGHADADPCPWECFRDRDRQLARRDVLGAAESVGARPADVEVLLFICR